MFLQSLCFTWTEKHMALKVLACLLMQIKSSSYRDQHSIVSSVYIPHNSLWAFEVVCVVLLHDIPNLDGAVTGTWNHITSRGFIRSRLPAVNCRLCCLSPPVTKPHIQESSSCNIKYRNGQKQLWVFVLHTLISSYTAAYLLPMAVYQKN